MEDKFTRGGIVLAGGKSSRMGTDKGFAEFGGKRLMDYALQTLRKSIDEICIVSNNYEYFGFGYPVFGDIFKNCGPLGGIHSGLTNSEGDWNMVISCDMPFLSNDFLWFLWKKLKGEQKGVIVPVHNGKPEPLCALYHTSALPKIENCIFNKVLKMQEAIEVIGCTYVEVPESQFDAGILFQNINAPENLQMAENHFRSLNK